MGIQRTELNTVKWESISCSISLPEARCLSTIHKYKLAWRCIFNYPNRENCISSMLVCRAGAMWLGSMDIRQDSWFFPSDWSTLLWLKWLLLYEEIARGHRNRAQLNQTDGCAANLAMLTGNIGGAAKVGGIGSASLLCRRSEEKLTFLFPPPPVWTGNIFMLPSSAYGHHSWERNESLLIYLIRCEK